MTVFLIERALLLGLEYYGECTSYVILERVICAYQSLIK